MVSDGFYKITEDKPVHSSVSTLYSFFQISSPHRMFICFSVSFDVSPLILPGEIILLMFSIQKNRSILLVEQSFCSLHKKSSGIIPWKSRVQFQCNRFTICTFNQC